MVVYSAALMAGGQSRRMGADKRFLLVNGQALWRQRLEVLRELAPQRVVVCAGMPPWPEAMVGEELVADALPGCGPLGGLLGAMRVCVGDFLVVAGVDMPFCPVAAWRELLLACREGCGAVFASLGRADDGVMLEPLVAVYPVQMGARMEAALEVGRFSLQELLWAAVAAGEMSVVTGGAARWFVNWNEPGDVRGTDVLGELADTEETSVS